MLAHQLEWTPEGGLTHSDQAFDQKTDFVLFFGSTDALSRGDAYTALRHAYPDACLVGCSTGGQFDRRSLEDDTVFGVRVAFSHASCALASADVSHGEDSLACGDTLGKALARSDLRAVLIISDGLHVNGSELVAGITRIVGPNVIVSGGLAGDGARFEQTWVAANHPARSGVVAAIGFYGDTLEIGTGSAGGWDAFGPRRAISKSIGNVLYELDGEPALDLYERYLGEEEAHNLPGSGLLFPLRIDDPDMPGRDVVRTILAVDKEARSMTFAGDVPQGWTAQLMRGTFDRLSSGAADAARQAQPVSETASGFSLLVSCIGRRLLMGQRAIDEIEAAAEHISKQHAMVGFYSYGEISPHARSGFCQLHNQTMTVMTVQEKVG